MWLTLKRIVKSGFVNFWRNGFVSLSSIIVMTITLFVVGSLIFLNAMLSQSLETLRDKVDVNVYFVTNAEEQSILAIKQALEAKPEVEKVTYVSRDDALARFRERHQNDEVELQALSELGENPLRASLSVKAKDPTQYASIAAFLASDQSVVSQDGTPIIAKVNFTDNKIAIERLSQLIYAIGRFGLIVTIVLAASSVMIVFNTIRLAIYIAREEIAVMRLVGASNAYIRGPFVFEGVMYGFISGIFTLLVFYPITLWLGPKTEAFFGNINIFTYYITHFPQVFGTILGTGIFLGAISSFLAVKKYLRV